MNRTEKIETFEHELGLIPDGGIAKFAEDAIAQLPDYFFVVPASSTGKYHPQYSLGEGGLMRHTKAVFYIALELLVLEQYNFEDHQVSIILAAILLHDGRKHGEVKADGSYEKYTQALHPLYQSRALKQNRFLCSTFQPQMINEICKLIETHMGQWNKDYKTHEEILPLPFTKAQKFVHLCDYLASRRFLDVDFDKITK